MNKKDTENFAGQKRSKRAKRPRNRPKRAKPGAFRVLERGAAGADGGESQNLNPNAPHSHATHTKRKPAKTQCFRRFFGRGRRTCLGCRLGRLVACVPLALARPTTRTARGAAAPCCQDIPHANEKNQVPQKRYLTFLAGAEGLEPSARGFGVDVGEHIGEREKADVTRFPPQARKRTVLVWCCEVFLQARVGRKSPEKP